MVIFHSYVKLPEGTGFSQSYGSILEGIAALHMFPSYFMMIPARFSAFGMS